MELLVILALAAVIYYLANSGSDSGAPSTRPTTTKIQKNVRGSTARKPSYTADPKISTLSAALQSSKTIRIRYTDQNGEISTRTVKPLYLEERHDDRILCLVAHCYLRDDTRTFVVSRISILS